MECAKRPRNIRKPSKNNLRKETHKWRVHEMMYSRRVAETNKSKLMTLMPVPEEVALSDLLPDWSMIPLCQHIPMPIMAPEGKVQFTRGTLGENILRMSKTFDLGDPYSHDLKIEYEPIHDPYLKHFLLAPHIKKYIEDLGILTEENKVKCTAKSYNAYRHYMWTIQRNGIKDKLLKKEKLHLLKMRFRDFLGVANHVKAQYLKVRSVEKEIMVRKFVKKFNAMLENMLLDLRKKNSLAGTQRVFNQRSDKWIIHLVKERAYPGLKALYKSRAFAATLYKGVNFVLKWRNHFLWEDERVDLMDRCRQLRDITLDLNWDRKIAEQTSLFKRDFIILNDYLKYSARRMRNRERWYRMDRLAMRAKFERLRYDRDYSIITKLRKRRKYGMAADFLMNTVKHAPVASRAYELAPKKIIRRRKRKQPKKQDILNPTRDYTPRVTGRPVHTLEMRGRIFAGYVGKLASQECMAQLARRYAYRALRASCASQLAQCRRDLKCMVARINHRQTLRMPTTKDLVKRYNWAKKLPYKAVSENWPAKVIVRKKLILAIRRYMKHERRRLRTMNACPEWSYYDKKAAKYKSRELFIPSMWRKLQLYFPLIDEQYHASDWKGNCKSLGKYLLYILVNNQSFRNKRKKVCSVLTQLRATIFKLKCKVRIVVDIIKRLVAKKIRLYYRTEIQYHIGIARGHVKSLLPKNPSDGDGYLEGLTFMIGFMKLSHINFQHVAPFADKFLLYVCFPKKFPLHFRKYRIDLHRRKQFLSQRIYPYRTNPLINLPFKLKIRKVREFRRIHEKDPKLMIQVYDPRSKKYFLLCKTANIFKFHEF